MINIPYRASRYLGAWNRRRFVQRLPKLPAISSADAVPVTVYSFSGESDWPEQAASIRSFLRFVGVPRRFVVVSDGSHANQSTHQLEKLHSHVSVVSLSSVLKPGLPAKIREYAAQHPLGKKLAALLSISADGPTIYSDSDILFFPGGNALPELFGSPIYVPRYLLDCWPSLDARLLAEENEKEQPVNSGFLIFDRGLNWNDALERLNGMEGDCGFFTEQTLINLAMKASGGQPLPADRFIMRAEDQFAYSDHYARPGIALRHYISSIRTKFWHQISLFE